MNSYYERFLLVSRANQRKREVHFQPVATDMGFCLSANVEPMGHFLSDKTPFKEVFGTAFSEDIKPGSSVVNNVGSGKYYGLTFTADTHVPIPQVLDRSKKRPIGMYIAVSGKDEVFGVRQVMEQLRPGHTTIVRVTTRVSNVTNDVRSMDADGRKCRLANENEGMELFKVYSQKACQLECQLKKSAGICRCIPWNYPNPMAGVSETCDTYGASCFEDVMEDQSAVDDCNCPQNCEDVTFTYNVQEIPLDPEEFCRERHVTVQFHQCKFFTSIGRVLSVMPFRGAACSFIPSSLTTTCPLARYNS